MSGQSLAVKLLSGHLVSGSLTAGEECRIRVDSTLLHQPDRVIPVSRAERVKADQVFIGSCTRSIFSGGSQDTGVWMRSL